MKKYIAGLLVVIMMMHINIGAYAETSGQKVDITEQATVLMELTSGTVLYEKEADVRMSPASITKIMTLLLIFDSLNQEKIHLDDEVVTSEYAKSMGGSQVFLEEGEKQTVETLIKCIVIASGNDASVAMAEYIAGSEQAFVEMMNQKAKELNLQNTHFMDCCGLSESDEHYTSARDVALMARTLLGHYPQISDYATIWMENITHVTQKGSSEFGLSNTNRLLKMSNNFEVTGLKTGSTSKAGYCLCATAVKDGVSLIAVVMHAPDYKVRFSQAQQLLNYGYATCSVYKDEQPPDLLLLPVRNGQSETVSIMYEKIFSYVSFEKEDFSSVTKEVQLEPEVCAPFEAGQKVGVLQYKNGNKLLGEVNIVTKEAVAKAHYADYLKKMIKNFTEILFE